jgi:hypothetical protein
MQRNVCICLKLSKQDPQSRWGGHVIMYKEKAQVRKYKMRYVRSIKDAAGALIYRQAKHIQTVRDFASNLFATFTLSLSAFYFEDHVYASTSLLALLRINTRCQVMSLASAIIQMELSSQHDTRPSDGGVDTILVDQEDLHWRD